MFGGAQRPLLAAATFHTLRSVVQVARALLTLGQPLTPQQWLVKDDDKLDAIDQLDSAIGKRSLLPWFQGRKDREICRNRSYDQAYRAFHV